MLTWIISKIICDTYENEFKRAENNIAMKIRFVLPIDYKKEEGHRWVELLIMWNSYVGVFYRECSDVVDINGINFEEDILKEGYEYVKTEGNWQCLTCHDSCWRNEGVEKFINKYQDKLINIKTILNWYEKIELSEEENKEFRKTVRLGRL